MAIVLNFKFDLCGGKADFDKLFRNTIG